MIQYIFSITITAFAMEVLASQHSFPPYLWLYFLLFQLPKVNLGLEADDHPPDYLQKVSSSLMPRHNACIVHLIASHQTYITNPQPTS